MLLPSNYLKCGNLEVLAQVHCWSMYCKAIKLYSRKTNINFTVVLIFMMVSVFGKLFLNFNKWF